MHYNCRFIKQSLHFHYREIRSCCSDAQGPVFVSNYKGQKIDWEQIANTRSEIQKNFKAGVIPKCCENCFQLESYEDDYTAPDANQIFISHWRHCNCGCVYCDNFHETKGKFSQEIKKSEFYDILPVLQSMIDSKVLSPQAVISFLGGECTMLEEFDDIIKLLDPHIETYIDLLSSGIKYNQTIENLFKKNKCGLIVSLDSGCAETYQKIKRVPYFYDVVENVRKYRNSNPNAKNNIYLKYIILKGLNDNIEELEKFLLLAKEIDLQKVQLDVDHNLNKPNNKIPEHYAELYSYFSNRSAQLGLTINISPQNAKFLEKANINQEVL